MNPVKSGTIKMSMDQSLQTRDLTCQLAGAVGTTVVDLDAWLREVSVPANDVSNFLVEPSQPIKIDFLPSMSDVIRTEFPDLYSHFFSVPSYNSNTFIASFIAKAILLPQGILIAGNKNAQFCVTETLGDSVGTAIDIHTETLHAEKQAGTNTISVTYDVSLLSPQPKSNVLNIVLSSINNYGHWHVHNLSFCLWLRDHIPALLRSVGATSIVLWCPHSNGGSGHKEYAVGILEQTAAVTVIDPFQIDTGIALDNAIICSTFNLDKGTRWPGIYNQLFSSARIPLDNLAPSKIYCNRSHAGSRGIENEAALEAALVEHGFTIVAPGHLNYDQQRSIFSNASLIVASHGASLTNMIYSHKTPTVIELTHPNYGPIQYGWFQHLAAVMGNHYGAYICKISDEFRNASYRDTYFHVDIDRLVFLLNHIS